MFSIPMDGNNDDGLSNARVHRRSCLPVDMASITIYLLAHKHGVHYLQLFVPAEIQEPDEAEPATGRNQRKGAPC